MYQLTPIPALQTNYIWTMTSHCFPGQAVIVDPGAAEPILAHLKAKNLSLAAILITHHHYDHTDGLDAILQAYPCPVYAGDQEPVKQATIPLADDQQFTIDELNLTLRAMHIPGHTRGHTAFYNEDMIFTGDTLFAAGCGRNFEGSTEQLYTSLQRILALAPETQVYCGHEYTEQNLSFGLLVEPDNLAMKSKFELVQLMRQEQQCTLPSSLADERNTNVFLRCHEAAVKDAAEIHSRKVLETPAAVFAVLREWKSQL